MPQLFQRRSNVIARVILLGAILGMTLLGWAVNAIYWSPYTTRVGVPIEQPVPFSHRHHYDELGIDCRFCHATVEKSAFAGLPDTATCMTCHSQLFTSAPVLAPVRHSLATDSPLVWNRVNKLPDYVFFNHSIHVAKGIGCATCHGPLNEMPMTWKSQTLYMKWCLECHRHPEQFIRPRAAVFDLHWQPSSDQPGSGRQLVADYHVNTTGLTDCSRCHR